MASVLETPTTTERDEIAAMVMRLKQFAHKPETLAGRGREAEVVSADDRQWAENMQLPQEFFEYFVLERAA